jgi:hypothetical protein
MTVPKTLDGNELREAKLLNMLFKDLKNSNTGDSEMMLFFRKNGFGIENL